MTIRHHLSEDLLLGHAAGNLPEAFALIVATHVSMCDECRARLMAYEVLGGAVLEQETAAMADDALARAMARIGGVAQAPRAVARAPKSVLPAPLLDYVGGDLEAVKWRTLGMGVRQAILPTSRRASARLLHIPAGQAVPDHGHRGRELTLVLQGAFRDATDRFGPGDVEIAGEELEHQPVAEPGVDCICLAVTDAPLRFTDLIPRLMQPFFRI
ncbi:ChrR family anti-sigma-E factor [Stagnihabitans tardus]|uniref:Transcriptional regulator n=1 Tax=Stagnihabitans tardus TaxID=2699202 RepID=A0AAE4YA73_9RHOB|nr:ChrR family anti-sigma-E factor [Stagnihabitans tardus]NBZ87563.1 transcriptional regulator [Stagnihabitans tardus]